MKKLILTLILICLMSIPAIAGTKAVQVESLWSGITDAVGLPLSSGLVYTYQAGSDTAKATYTDNDKTTPASNPIVLDSEGKALIFADGLYKFVIKDSTGLTTLDTLDDLSYFNQYYTETVHASDYGDGSCTDETITTAQTAIGSDVRTLVLKPCTWVVDENTAINANVNLKLEAGAVLSIATGVTLTINGTLESAPMHQIFSIAGTGKITPTQKYGKKFIPEMWGLNTTPGTTDMTSYIQNCINAAATAGTECDCTGYNLFSKLYFYYDASLNPNFPQTYPGVFKFKGSQMPSKSQITNADYTKGTILKSNDATGPAINIDGSSGGTAIIRAMGISDMAIMATNTTYVIDADYAAMMSNLSNLLVYQAGAGGGILWEDTYSNTWNNVWAIGAGEATSAVGITIRNINTTGGLNNLYNVHSEEFDKDFEFGHSTDGSGVGIQVYCYGCEAGSSKTYGVLFGDGIAKGVWLGGHIEGAFNSGASIGVLMKNGASYVTISDARIIADIGAQFGDGTDVGGTEAHFNCKVMDNYITAKKTGVQVYGLSSNRGKYILRNTIEEHATPEAGTTGIVIEDTFQRSLVVEDNDIDANFDTEITNKARINSYRKIDNSTYYTYRPFLVKDFTTGESLFLYQQQHLLTNGGASAVITLNLPVATQGLEFQFIRKNATYALRLNPDGSEIIRGGGAGKYLSLDTDYTKVILRCLTAGEWEIWYSSGTTSFES